MSNIERGEWVLEARPEIIASLIDILLENGPLVDISRQRLTTAIKKRTSMEVLKPSITDLAIEFIRDQKIISTDWRTNYRNGFSFHQHDEIKVLMNRSEIDACFE